MRSIGLFILAGILEIGGGYLVWLWLRGGHSLFVGVVGLSLLASYGVVPVLQPLQHPFGRVYAAYGAVFIVLSVAWGWGVDKHRPDFVDTIGAAIALAGAAVMMLPRGAS